jgi:hypothetical protein
MNDSVPGPDSVFFCAVCGRLRGLCAGPVSQSMRRILRRGARTPGSTGRAVAWINQIKQSLVVVSCRGGHPSGDGCAGKRSHRVQPSGFDTFFLVMVAREERVVYFVR